MNTATANGGSCAMTLAAASIPPAVREKASINMTSASSRLSAAKLISGSPSAVPTTTTWSS